MDKFERIYALHTELANARLPVSKKTLEEKLECTHATVERIIRDMSLFLDAPIEYNRNANGYYYDIKANPNYELPGLWFNPSELHALLTAYHLLSNVDPGILDAHIAPLKNKIQKLLYNDKAGDTDIGRRIRILKMAARRHNPKHFSAVAGALINRQQLFIRYRGRERNKQSERVVSPQRVIHYRDNWYLDAWCHKREALRNFSIDRIQETKIQNLPAKEISDAALDRYFATAYGIFAGEPKYTAVLRFNSNIARWVSDEQWHPQQNGQYELDGSYILEIPYNDPRELIRDILKYGADVQVLSPGQLKTQIKQQLEKAINLYVK